MTDVIEVTDNITGENFVVDPSVMRDFLEARSNFDPTTDTDAADEIERICQDALMGGPGFSYLMGIDYAPGVYADELPACGWGKVED